MSRWRGGGRDRPLELVTPVGLEPGGGLSSEAGASPCLPSLLLVSLVSLVKRPVQVLV